MLALTRGIQEKLIINGNIIITVTSIRGNQVRLSIEAPAEIPIHREEIFKALQQENKTFVEKKQST